MSVSEEDILSFLSQYNPQQTGYLRSMDMPYLDLASQLGLDLSDPGSLDLLSAASNSYRAGASLDDLRATLANRGSYDPYDQPYDPNDPLSIGRLVAGGGGSGGPDNHLLAQGYLAPEGVRSLGYSTDGHTGVAFGDEAIHTVRDDMRDRSWKGIGQVAALVAGGAALGGLGAGAGGGAGGFNAARGVGTIGRLGAAQGIKDMGRSALRGSFMPGESAGIPNVITDRSRGSILGALGMGGSGPRGGPQGPLEIMSTVGAGLGLAGGLGTLLGSDESESATPPAAQDDPPLKQLTYSRQRLAGPADYYTYGRSGGEHRFFSDSQFSDAATPAGQPRSATPETSYVPQELLNRQMMYKARGGTAHVRGPGSGREDKIPALLSADEYVMDAETVALLGDGSPEEGARRLDQLRERVRSHKGKALAKGKFSPAARDPEHYIGKSRGGSIRRVIKGGLPKPPLEDRQAQLDAVRRFEAAFREAARRRETPMKKARGGGAKLPSVGPTGLVRLANQFQRALASGNTDRVSQLASVLDGHRKGAADEGIRAFARGGSVTAALKKLLSRGEEPDRMPPINNRVLTGEQIATELEKLNPNSPVLRTYRASQRNTNRKSVRDTK